VDVLGEVVYAQELCQQLIEQRVEVKRRWKNSILSSTNSTFTLLRLDARSKAGYVHTQEEKSIRTLVASNSSGMAVEVFKHFVYNECADIREILADGSALIHVVS
jgi:hypothetical protein